MSITLVADLRAHLNLDHTADDALLAAKLDAAEAHIAGMIGFVQLSDPLEPPLKQAVLMLAAYWYESREAAAPGSPFAVPFGVAELVQPFRVWTL